MQPSVAVSPDVCHRWAAQLYFTADLMDRMAGKPAAVADEEAPALPRFSSLN